MIAQQEVEVFQFKNQKQAEFHDTVIKSVVRLLNYRYFFYGGAIRGGKLLPLETPIATPSGWTTMGELSVGDLVIDADGKPTEVIWVSEINNDPEAWELLFNDGSKAICDIGHQWVTTTFKERVRIARASDEFRIKRKKYRQQKGTGKRPDLSKRNSDNAFLKAPVPNYRGNTRTTKEIIETLYEGKFANHAIVNCSPLDLPEQDLLIKPYTLGAWLGDGTSCSGGLTGIDKEVWEEIEKDGYKVSHHKEEKSHGILGIVGDLRKLGVLNNKHIPQIYLRASIEQRLSLLQGLCDTDGTCGKEKGCIEFTTTSEKIKDGFLELVYSLGIKPSCREGRSTLNGKDFGKKWRILFWFERPCFRIKRKAERQKLSKGTTRHYRTIIGANPVVSVPMKCIAVSSPSKTYLCGKEMIPTHNTFICLFLFLTFARMFPRSRWHIFRSDFPELEDTTIPSMEKLIGTEGKDFVWKKSKSNYHVLFENGSKIFFKSENIDRDPELNWMLGLETNGIFLEQMEGLSEKLFSRAMERAGSWVIPDMPPPIILGTFNPTNTWVKKLIYDRFFKNELPEDWYFEEALPSDNPFVTEDQWKNWENLDDVSYNQLIKGIWRFLTDAKLFAYSFDRAKHVVNVETEEGKALMQPKKSLPLRVIFDFNVDPITALIAQTDGLTWCKVFAEYRLRNSDIFELTERVKNDWGMYFIVVTGDASGRARSALTKGNRSYVDTIKTELRLSSNQLQFPTKNPSVANTRILMNSIFKKHPSFLISSACLYLIDDLESVVVDNEGDIDKKKDSTKTHLLDNLRYLMWNYLRAFLNVKL